MKSERPSCALIASRWSSRARITFNRSKSGRPERGVALGDEIVLLALQRAAAARIVAAGVVHHPCIHRVDLAIEIGQFGIGTDRLFDRAPGSPRN